MNVSDLNNYHKNPRKISSRQKKILKEKLEKFGDLSGIVHDLNSNEVISGNQRSDIFKSGKAKIVLQEEFKEPTKTGTVATGYVEYKDERYNYRAVRWSAEECEEAVIVANRVGGEFDFELIKEKFDVSKLLFYGFEEEDLNKVLEESVKKGIHYEDDGNKRKMSDYFIVAPFSILDTTKQEWIDRRRKWNALVLDDGSARPEVLSGGDNVINNINAGTSILDTTLVEIIVHWFTEKGFKCFDLMAGGTAFGFVSSYLGRSFEGIELRKEQAEFNQKQFDRFNLDAVTHCDTAENADLYFKDESKDFFFTCPPYADLEKYSDDPRDLSNMPYDEFFDVYGKILTSSYTKLKNNRFAVVVIGEVRDRKTGHYIKLVPKTIDIMEKAGYIYYNEIILVNSVGTLPLRAGRFMNSSRKIGKRHQNVLVFYKGDVKKIDYIFSDIIPKNADEEGNFDDENEMPI